MPSVDTSRKDNGALEPFRDVERAGAGFVALSGEPWLRLRVSPAPAGKWIRLVYRAGLLDPLTRPILRLNTLNDGARDVFLPGPLHGRGIWIGHIPDGAFEMLVSPAAEPGPFAFEIESCSIFPFRRVLRRAFRGSREKTLAWLSAKARGMSVEAMEELTYALCHEPLDRYQRWRGRRWRPLEIDGIDAPAADWRRSPHVRLAVAPAAGSRRGLRALLARLEAQPYPNWSLAVVADHDGGKSSALAESETRGRLLFVPPKAPLAALATGLAPDALIGRCATGDEPADFAFAALAEAARRRPGLIVAYGDEDSIDRRGLRGDPRLKPDWSPLFQSQTNYLGAAVFVRAGALAGGETAERFADPDARVDRFVDLAAADVVHVRRVLLSRAPARGDPPDVLGSPYRGAATTAEQANAPAATIVIPTRDRLDLLRACVDSLSLGGGGADFEAIVVDNGSAERETLEWLAKLEARPRFRVLRRPGRFNFSALCNDAAAAARGDVLVFLNNDTEVLDPRWLDRLIDPARDPRVGAVGAKLVFASGRVQHAGVVAGLVGRAGHVFHGLGRANPGYLGRIGAAHEVSAVTAACLAVQKSKFDAIGGFNVEDLPIELNDVDLCLRLREAGLVNIYTPECELIHRESETRTRVSHHSKVYARERAYFTSTWLRAMRDDPYFHPSLSLFSTRPSLA